MKLKKVPRSRLLMPISSIPSISRTRSISLSLCTLRTKIKRNNDKDDNGIYFHKETNDILVEKRIEADIVTTSIAKYFYSMTAETRQMTSLCYDKDLFFYF